MIGIKLRLFNDVTPRVNLTGIQAIYWDAEEPVYTALPTGKSAVVTTDSEGDAYIDLSGVTELGVGDYGFLTLYQPNISDPRKSLAFMGRVQLSEISAGAYMPPRFVTTDVPQYETDALMAFFHATDGPNWTNNTGWGIDPVVGNWAGVTVVDGHVTRLNLSANAKTLSGPGAPFLAALSELTYLDLYLTGVTGSISGFNVLVKLTSLNLTLTGVTGSISGFNSLVNLNYLSLQNTGITIDTTPVFVRTNGSLYISEPTWGTVESPTQVTLNIVANLKNGWSINVIGGIPTWVLDMV